MTSLAEIDLLIILVFFGIVLLIGFSSRITDTSRSSDYILGGRNVGIIVFVLINVSTWYGGVLGIGEFTYSYGLSSWLTQGMPYYFFALLFAFLLAGKIRRTEYFTISEKIASVYGNKTARNAAILVFILVNPAPYLLIFGTLLSVLTGLQTTITMLVGIFVSIIYLIKWGYRSDIRTDIFEFFVMFIGFGITLWLLITNFGGVHFLRAALPEQHLNLTGGLPPLYIIVWFLIALWTFADPGFHQRCYAAKTPDVAKYGIIISIFLWFIFDFLTTGVGLYARALLPEIDRPASAFPLLGLQILNPGIRGIFFAAMFATVMSTLNSYFFMSGVTFARDIVLWKDNPMHRENKSTRWIRIGIVISSIIAYLIAVSVDSVIGIWYLAGSIVIPPLLFLIVSSYYETLRIPIKYANVQMFLSLSLGLIWHILRVTGTLGNLLEMIEPMIMGLLTAFTVYIYAVMRKKKEPVERSAPKKLGQ